MKLHEIMCAHSIEDFKLVKSELALYIESGLIFNQYNCGGV